MEYGQILAKLRKKAGLSQRDLACELGVSNGAIAMWETNKRQPDIEMLIKISNFYNLSLDTLVGIKKDMETAANTTHGSEALPLSDEEIDLLKYYRQLSLIDKRWIMGQIIDRIERSNDQ